MLEHVFMKQSVLFSIFLCFLVMKNLFHFIHIILMLDNHVIVWSFSCFYSFSHLFLDDCNRPLGQTTSTKFILNFFIIVAHTSRHPVRIKHVRSSPYPAFRLGNASAFAELSHEWVTTLETTNFFATCTWSVPEITNSDGLRSVKETGTTNS